MEIITIKKAMLRSTGWMTGDISSPKNKLVTGSSHFHLTQDDLVAFLAGVNKP